jgi:hypothetical protein
MDLDESPFALPTTVIMEPSDKEEVVIDQLSLRYAKLIEQWQQEERQRFYSRETRYESEHPEPVFPILVCRSEHSTHARPEVVLLDGRRAKLLDGHRIQTQCGIQEIMTMEVAQGLRKRPGHTRQCPSCGGKHLPEHRSRPAPVPHTSLAIPCTKCQADLRSSSYWDDTDTLVCRCCAKRYTRPLDGLTTTEQSSNEQAITDWLTTHAVADASDVSGPETGTGLSDSDEVDSDAFDTDGETEEHAALDGADTEDVSPFDDPVNMDEVPETTPLDMEELQQIFHLVNHPEQRGTVQHPIVVQQLIALAERRMVDVDSDAEFKEVFGKVVSEEISHLSDLLHEPAYHLFQMSHSPMRQTLLDRALQQKDNPATRMAVWAAAGRLLKECNLPWLRQFTVNRQEIPKTREGRIQFFLELHEREKTQVQPIVDWLLSLSPEDLSILAGDPDSTHPFLHHPDPSVFEETDRLMTGLVAYLANELQRFREKKAGCRLKASDHGLAVESLQAIAIQHGLMPAPQAPPSQAAA